MYGIAVNVNVCGPGSRRERARALSWRCTEVYAAPMNGVKPWAGRLVALPSLDATVAQAIATPSACVPDGTVVLSYFNAHHKEMRRLQFERVKSLTCLMVRVVSVCYGTSDEFGTCVAAPEVPPSTFRRGAYIELIWAKWRLVHQALGVARTVLFVDTDVVLLRNPFPHMGDVRRFDMRFQTSLACPAPTCAAAPRFEGYARLNGAPLMRPCQVNGGFLLISNRELVRQVLERETRSIGGNAVNRGDIDQDTADPVVRSGNFSFCPLPPTLFVGQCFYRSAEPVGNRSFFENLKACQLATYHTTCIGMTRQKANAMAAMLNRTAHCVSSLSGHGATGPVPRRRIGSWHNLPGSMKLKSMPPEPTLSRQGLNRRWRANDAKQKG